jgi:hypothetical protein
VRSSGVVEADDLWARDLRQVLIKAIDDRLLGAVVVEVVDLDVGEDGAEKRQGEVCAVALVGLDHQPLPSCPLRPRAHVGDVAADDEAGARTGLGQDEHQHRGGGGLAVCAGDCERLCHRADRREHA